MARHGAAVADFEQRVEERIAQLKGDANVLGVFIGGSYARHELHEFSDADIVALVKEAKRVAYDPLERVKVGYYTEAELLRRFCDQDWMFSRPLLLNGKIVYDPQHRLAQLRERIREYPEDIRQYEMRANVLHAQMQASRSRYALKHGDVASALYFMQKACAEILFFAYVREKIYLESERKLLSKISELRQAPEDFERRMRECMFVDADASAEEIKRRLAVLGALIAWVEAAYEREGAWKPEYAKVAEQWGL